MKIITVYSPVFEYNGVDYSVESEIFTEFSKLDELIQKKENKGATHCFIYNICNLHNGKLITAVGGKPILNFIRWKFVTLPDDGYNPDLGSLNIIKHIL